MSYNNPIYEFDNILYYMKLMSLDMWEDSIVYYGIVDWEELGE